MKSRKGSLLVVLAYGSLMAVVVLGMMSLASSLYTTAKDSAKTYSDIQTYRAAMEIACYQYVTSLESAIVTKNLDADWISVTGNAIYTQALDAITGSIGKAEDPNTWSVSDLGIALNAANISDHSVLTSLYAKLNGVQQSFELKIVEPPRLDWENADSWKRSGDAYIALDPLIVDVRLSARGESLVEQFFVDGLFLDVKSDTVGSGASRETILTIMIVEKAEGVRITRDVV